MDRQAGREKHRQTDGLIDRERVEEIDECEREMGIKKKRLERWVSEKERWEEEKEARQMGEREKEMVGRKRGERESERKRD